jgi:hypothetical protein
MEKKLSNYSFPYTNQIMTFSAVMIFLPIILINAFDTKNIIDTQPFLFKMILFIPTLFAMLGFIYCILGLHFNLLRGDEIKLKIHFRALHITFTATIISLFVLIVLFLNFAPRMLNWIMVILAVVAIISYLFASLILKDKYKIKST